MIVEPPDARPADTAVDDDALLLTLCTRAHQLDASDLPNATAKWDHVVKHLSALPAQTMAGMRAKAELLRGLTSTEPSSRRAEHASPDEQLLCSLLNDILGADGRGWEDRS